jgi:hypothetical protein
MHLNSWSRRTCTACPQELLLNVTATTAAESVAASATGRAACEVDKPWKGRHCVGAARAHHPPLIHSWAERDAGRNSVGRVLELQEHVESSTSGIASSTTRCACITITIHKQWMCRAVLLRVVCLLAGWRPARGASSGSLHIRASSGSLHALLAGLCTPSLLFPGLCAHCLTRASIACRQGKDTTAAIPACLSLQLMRSRK